MDEETKKVKARSWQEKSMKKRAKKEKREKNETASFVKTSPTTNAAKEEVYKENDGTLTKRKMKKNKRAEKIALMIAKQEEKAKIAGEVDEAEDKAEKNDGKPSKRRRKRKRAGKATADTSLDREGDSKSGKDNSQALKREEIGNKENSNHGVQEKIQRRQKHNREQIEAGRADKVQINGTSDNVDSQNEAPAHRKNLKEKKKRKRDRVRDSEIVQSGDNTFQPPPAKARKETSAKKEPSNEDTPGHESMSTKKPTDKKKKRGRKMKRIVPSQDDKVVQSKNTNNKADENAVANNSKIETESTHQGVEPEQSPDIKAGEVIAPATDSSPSSEMSYIKAEPLSPGIKRNKLRKNKRLSRLAKPEVITVTETPPDSSPVPVEDKSEASQQESDSSLPLKSDDVIFNTVNDQDTSDDRLVIDSDMVSVSLDDIGQDAVIVSPQLVTQISDDLSECIPPAASSRLDPDPDNLSIDTGSTLSLFDVSTQPEHEESQSIITNSSDSSDPSTVPETNSEANQSDISSDGELVVSRNPDTLTSSNTNNNNVTPRRPVTQELVCGEIVRISTSTAQAEFFSAHDADLSQILDASTSLTYPAPQSNVTQSLPAHVVKPVCRRDNNIGIRHIGRATKIPNPNAKVTGIVPDNDESWFDDWTTTDENGSESSYRTATSQPQNESEQNEDGEITELVDISRNDSADKLPQLFSVDSAESSQDIIITSPTRDRSLQSPTRTPKSSTRTPKSASLMSPDSIRSNTSGRTPSTPRGGQKTPTSGGSRTPRSRARETRYGRNQEKELEKAVEEYMKARSPPATERREGAILTPSTHKTVDEPGTKAASHKSDDESTETKSVPPSAREDEQSDSTQSKSKTSRRSLKTKGDNSSQNSFTQIKQSAESQTDNSETESVRRSSRRKTIDNSKLAATVSDKASPVKTVSKRRSLQVSNQQEVTSQSQELTSGDGSDTSEEPSRLPLRPRVPARLAAESSSDDQSTQDSGKLSKRQGLSSRRSTILPASKQVMEDIIEGTTSENSDGQKMTTKVGKLTRKSLAALPQSERMRHESGESEATNTSTYSLRKRKSLQPTTASSTLEIPTVRRSRRVSTSSAEAPSVRKRTR